MWKEFKDFVMRGNVLDLAVAVIIGAAFGTIISSLVNDIIMPPIGLLLGGVDFSNLFINLGPDKYTALADAQAAGAPTLNYGLFINAIISCTCGSTGSDTRRITETIIGIFMVLAAVNDISGGTSCPAL